MKVADATMVVRRNLTVGRLGAVRAVVEHTFLRIKWLRGSAKTRCRGFAKNTNRLVLMCVLFNIRYYGKPLTG